MQIHWAPNPGPQTEVLRRTENEILYGGARGGGKTDAGMAFLSRWVSEPKFRALVIREDYVDLNDWLDRAQSFYSPCGAKVVGTPAEIQFPSGAVIRAGHLHDKNAYTKYQGHEYQKLLMEELTHIPSEELYEKLRASNRSTVEGLTPQTFATANPGGVGHLWVKSRFVDVAAPGVPYRWKDPETGLTLSRIFIPARVEDNPVLMQKDPSYVARLNSLPTELRKAWREGSWDVFEVKGAYYAADMTQARAEGRIGKLPIENIPVHTGWDIGVDDQMAIWFIQTIGKEIRLIDYEEYTDRGIDYGVEIMHGKGYRYGTHYFPHDMKVREATNARSRKEFFEETYMATFGREADAVTIPRGEPADRVQAVRILFPRFYIDNERCSVGINRLNNYRKDYDEARQTYRSTPLHDINSHGADALGAFAVGFEEALQLSRPKRTYQPPDPYAV